MERISKIIHGECLEKLKDFPDNYFDSCVTDPPYGIGFMGKAWDTFKADYLEDKRTSESKRRPRNDGRKSTGFGDSVYAGTYDLSLNGNVKYQQWYCEIMKEVLRVLKPGAHILSACGTRTYHRMACAIEDAGFEIRDVISWIYGSGFPKSLNVNKSLNDRICTCEELAKKSESKHIMQRLHEEDLSQAIRNEDSTESLLFNGLQEHGSQSDWKLSSKGDEDGEEPCMEGRCNDVQEKGQLQERDLCESNGMDADGSQGWVYNGTPISNGENVQNDINETGSSSSPRPQPKQQQPDEFTTLPNQCDTQGDGAWQNCSRCGKPILPDGIGTALKPATEFWTLARKPLSENTIAENVLKHGTGGINIDGSRIEFKNSDDFKSATYGTGVDINNNSYKEGYKQTDEKNIEANPLGRFPANVIFDEFTGKELDKQSGTLTSGSLNPVDTEKQNTVFGANSGGASRFFYCAKADNYERNKGLKGFDGKYMDESREVGSAGGTNPRNRGAETQRKNHHPTVKPIDLMRYLAKLITPKNGIVLDPFNGSGTTGIAAKLELMNYVGIEMNEEYCKISEARIAAWNPPKYKEQKLF